MSGETYWSRSSFFLIGLLERKHQERSWKGSKRDKEERGTPEMKEGKEETGREKQM